MFSGFGDYLRLFHEAAGPAVVILALIGVLPAQRLLLEANYGYVLLSNGVPIGYGGVSPLFRQANTGINVFDPFRGSEATYLWAQTLRAFRSLFGVRRFIINGYQFGAGNAEAIASGAYWFYYRLGFRPTSAANQPVWMASCGPTTPTRSSRCSHRHRVRVPRHKATTPSSESAMRAIPIATITW